MTATSLDNNDTVLFLPNILRNGEEGNMILVQNLCYFRCIKGGGFTFIDDKKSPLFKSLKDIYWKNRKMGHDTPFSISSAYYTYAILNGNYTIVKIGRTIHEKILNNQDGIIKKEYFKVQVSGYGPFKNFDSSYFTGEYGNFSKEFLLKRNFDLEKINEHLKWTNKDNFDYLLKWMKENSINIDIAEIQNKIRTRKLERIIEKIKYEKI